MPTFSVFGRQLRPDDAGFVDALAAAHAQRHRPRCLCTSPEPQMYVARWHDRYMLKRMPLTGNRHAPTCSSSEPVIHPLPVKAVDPTPGEKADPETLWPAFAMSKREPQEHAATPVPAISRSSDGRPRLSLRGLLDYLWERAELTRWHPGFARRRNWAIVRKRLLCAAEGRNLGGRALPDCLFVPKPFCMAWPDANPRRLSAHWQRTAQGRPGHPLALLLGELKVIRPERGGEAKAFIWHVARCPFTLSDVLYLDVCRRFGRELSQWASSKGARIVAAATFFVDSSGVPNIEEISLMPTSWEWLPLEDPFDRRLADALVEGGRHFRKAGRDAAWLDRCPAAFELLDTAKPPTPLYVEKWRGGSPGPTQTTSPWVWRFGDPRLPPFQGETTQASEPYDRADGWLSCASSTHAAEACPDDPEDDDTPSGMPRLSHTTAA